jgi:hypothetical protein
LKSILSLFIILALIAGCKKAAVEPEHYTACDVPDPVEDLPWLKSEIAAQQKDSAFVDLNVMRGTYKSRTVIWISVCCPTCDLLPPTARYCDGSIAGQFITEIKNADLTETVELWRTHHGVCQ